MSRTPSRCGILTLAVLLAAPPSGLAQLTGTENGAWRYLGGDAGHTRSSPLNQINASNFAKLKVAWIFRGDNFGPGDRVHVPVHAGLRERRAVHGRRPAAAGRGDRRRHGRDALDLPRARHERYLRSPRTDFGKGVAYAEVDGRGVIYISTPGFFLWALDARTGRPLENWGTPVPLKDFPKSGVIDMIPDLVSDWEPWLTWKGEQLRPGLRASQDARRDHVLVAADRGERRRRGARRPRAQLRPDPDRERPGRHPGLRREDRQAPLEVPRHPAARRVRPRDVGERRLEVFGEHGVVGARGRRPAARARLHRRRTPRPTSSTRAIARATTSSAAASSRSTSRRASGSGTSRCTTASSGTTTSRPRRS